MSTRKKKKIFLVCVVGLSIQWQKNGREIFVETDEFYDKFKRFLCN